MPAEGIQSMKHSEILSFEEIVTFTQKAVEFGIRKVRLTGGEPLVRKDIVKLVSMLAEIPELEDISLTTNGLLLDRYAQQLVKAGLNRINISLDTINPEIFAEQTRGGDIQQVFKGIEAAKAAGLRPIKINSVLMGMADEETAKLESYCNTHNLQLRFIHQMNLKTGEFSVVEGGDGGNCAQCNRLRLTANGKVKPCLFSDIEYDVRELGSSEAINQAIENKPKTGTYSKSNQFYNVGG